MSDPAKVSKITTTDGVAHEINAATVNEHTVAADVPSTAVFTDEKVTQTESTTRAAYEVIFSGTADNTTRTEGVGKSQYFTYNPYEQTLKVISGASEFSSGYSTSVMAGGIGGIENENNPATYLLSLQGAGSGKPGLFLHNQGSNNVGVQVSANDIKLFGTSNTWDGGHISLKDALTPAVVTTSSVDLNSFMLTGKYILTGSISTRTNFPINQPGYLEVTRWSESSTNWFCRQDYKMYNTGVWMDETYSRIGTSTDGGSTWTWNRWYSQTHFLPGETYTINGNTVCIGYVTSSSKELFVAVWLPKSMEHTTGISSKPSTISLIVRGGAGQYLQGSNSGYSFKLADCERIQPSFLRLKFTKSDSSAFSNCVNNDPYAVQFNANATITFS